MSNNMDLNSGNLISNAPKNGNTIIINNNINTINISFGNGGMYTMGSMHQAYNPLNPYNNYQSNLDSNELSYMKKKRNRSPCDSTCGGEINCGNVPHEFKEKNPFLVTNEEEGYFNHNNHQQAFKDYFNFSFNNNSKTFNIDENDNFENFLIMNNPKETTTYKGSFDGVPTITNTDFNPKYDFNNNYNLSNAMDIDNNSYAKDYLKPMTCEINQSKPVFQLMQIEAKNDEAKGGEEMFFLNVNFYFLFKRMMNKWKTKKKLRKLS